MIFQPAVIFPVYVEGKKMNAFVNEEVDDPVQTVFRISFSDGFADEFLIEDDGNVYGSGIAAISYAKALRFDLAHVVGLDPGRFYYNFQHIIDGEKANVWVIEGENDNNQALFKIYYLEYFRFALQHESGKWVITHKPVHGRKPDEEVARQAGFMLDALLGEAHPTQDRKTA